MSFALIVSIINIVYVLLIVLFFVKLFQSIGRKTQFGNKSKSQSYTFQKNTHTMTNNRTSNRPSSAGNFIDSERKKERRKLSNPFRSFGNNKDVDCDLDERIFGPKGQHKDIF